MDIARENAKHYQMYHHKRTNCSFRKIHPLEGPKVNNRWIRRIERKAKNKRQVEVGQEATREEVAPEMQYDARRTMREIRARKRSEGEEKEREREQREREREREMQRNRVKGRKRECE